MSSFEISPPTELWIGQHQKLVLQVYDYLDAQLFLAAGSVARDLLRAHQHHAVLWLQPEKNQYRRIDLEIIFATTAFALDPGVKFFFIIEHADLLTSACANSLLKLLEEPPAGYNFILLAERKELLLPTIISRSLIKEFTTHNEEAEVEGLYKLFIDPSRTTHAQVMQAFESAKPTEYQTKQILDDILRYWLDQQMDAIRFENDPKFRQADRMARIFTYALEQPPMPGSTKAFWRNLFLLISV
jgi:DNA polymerase-3 subunit delta'